MPSISVISIILFYLLMLFSLAWWVDKKSEVGEKILASPWIYALSLSVYCTAWTFYGSVGRAATNGIDFITTFLGPSLFIPLWFWFTRKMIRVSNHFGISSLADYISSRYGNSVFLGIFVTVFSIFAVLPYIAIQLKAIGIGFDLLSFEGTSTGSKGMFLSDSSFYVTGILAVFIILFGTRNIETSNKHHGLISIIATESVIKLLAFVGVGIYVTYNLYDGVGDIFEKASQNEELAALFVMPDENLNNWFWMLGLAFLAVMFLPRQFQMAVLENNSERHLKKAVWIFPMYLLLINLFVLPIAFAGKMMLDGSIDPDTYVLTLPLSMNQNGLAVLAYVGGFSASTSMIMVSVFALTNMVSNNLIMPFVAKNRESHKSIAQLLLGVRRLSIIVLMFLAYMYFRLVADNYSIVSIGIMSFIGVAQFAPSILIGTYWKIGSKAAACVSMIVGFSFWFYLLIIPNVVQVGIFPEILGEILILDLSSIAGSMGMSPVTASFFISISLNTLSYVVVSVLFPQGKHERKQAEIFVDINKYSQEKNRVGIWKGVAKVGDLTILMENVLGKSRTQQAILYYSHIHGPWIDEESVQGKMVPYVETILSGAVGAASARILVSSTVKEEELDLKDVISVVKESQELLELNKKLKSQSETLEKTTEKLVKANLQLKAIDREKDSFISTVTHELRTPITSIRSFAEILFDNPDLGDDEKSNFLEIIVRETERMSRLISEVLDLEKLASGVLQLNLTNEPLGDIVNESVENVQQWAQEKNISILKNQNPEINTQLDRDRIIQVLENLLSNAIKYHDKSSGIIEVTTRVADQGIQITVSDDGPGIAVEYQDKIFQKFYQIRKRDNLKDKGTGLGLAITKSIVEMHGGSINVRSELGKGTEMTIILPFNSIRHGESEKEKFRTG